MRTKNGFRRTSVFHRSQLPYIWREGLSQLPSQVSWGGWGLYLYSEKLSRQYAITSLIYIPSPLRIVGHRIGRGPPTREGRLYLREGDYYYCGRKGVAVRYASASGLESSSSGSLEIGIWHKFSIPTHLYNYYSHPPMRSRFHDR